MLALTVRSLGARKFRTVLTATAVFLGVALISGTYILTDTINRTFDGIFETAGRGVDVSVTPRETFTQDGNPPAFSEAVLARVRATPGVAKAAGGLFDSAAILGKDGKLISARAPSFVTAAEPAPFNPFRYPQGRAPAADDEIALDQASATKAGYRLGDRVVVAGNGPRRAFRLVGIARFGDTESLAGATAGVLTLPAAQAVLDARGRLESVDVQVDPGVAPATVVSRLRAILPATLTVRTGEEQAKSQAQDTKGGFSFLTTLLLVFAGVALFVGAFMIFNTFSITTAQRTREFALLRTLGATRRQILRSVIGEALAVGVAASVLGLIAGLAIAPALKALFTAFGADLPAQGTVVETRTIVVSLLVGTVITLLASLSPALRATRVPPMAALREGAVLPRGRVARLRTPLGIGVTAAGVVFLLLGLFAGSGIAIVGVGAVLVFLGVAMLSRFVVRPLARVVGAPMRRLRGIAGLLARENASRNPSRTASTAAALMIGLALVTFVSIFAAGVKASIDEAVDEGFQGAFVIRSSNDFTGVPAAAAAAIRDVPGVATVAQSRTVEARVQGQSGEREITGVDTANLTEVFKITWDEGSDATLRSLGTAGAILSTSYADERDLGVGDPITLVSAQGRRVPLTVRGIHDDDTGLLSAIAVSLETMARGFGVQQDRSAFVGVRPGASLPAVQRRIDAVLAARFPTVESQTKSQFKDDVAGQVNQLLGFFYVLLSLSVIVSLFGIVNTLALSIYERTRELGLLRAVGMSRRQVRTMVRYESVITAMIGAVLGVVLGVFFAAVMTPALQDEGLKFVLPVGTVLVLLVLAALAGVLAAIGPARRAAKLDVLDALAYE